MTPAPMHVITWPAPAEEAPSPHYTVAVDGVPVFVYGAPVRTEILQKPGLWSHKPDAPSGAAAFALFDLAAPATVTVRPERPFRTATVLPSRAGIRPELADGAVRFRLEAPRHLTVLLDGSDSIPLHLFVGEPERDVPKPDDPNVVYFGPGVHTVHQLKVRSGQTVYVAGGAIVKAALRPDEKGTYNEKWQVTFHGGAILDVNGAENVRIAGRGILDASRVPHPGRPFLVIQKSRDVRVEGLVLRDAANWNVPIRHSERVRVDDLRIISGRLNSDGINSCNSRDVRIRRCFVRNHDDSIVAKTLDPGDPSEDIAVEDCTLWSDWGYSLGVSYETRAPIRRVAFRRCDILCARHWCLGIHLSDGSTVSDVTFSDIGVADPTLASGLGGSHNALTAGTKLLRLHIGADCWGHDPERGHIRDITVTGVVVDGAKLPPSEILGFDADHAVENVRLRNIRLRGQPPAADAAALDLTTNAYVRAVSVESD